MKRLVLFGLMVCILFLAGCNNGLSKESCEILLNPFKKTDCYARLAVQENDLQICKLAPYTDCEDYFAGAKAVEKGYMNYCDVIGKTDDYVNGGFRGFPGYCKIYFAVVKKDDSYCDVEGVDQQRCIQEVAIEKGDIEACNKISEGWRKTYCIEKIAEEKINYDYCERDRCYQNIAESVLFDAISYQNVNFCDNLKTYDIIFATKNPDLDIVPSELCKEFVKSECIGLNEEECKSNVGCEPIYGMATCPDCVGCPCSPPPFIGCSDKNLQYNISYFSFPRYLEIS